MGVDCVLALGLLEDIEDRRSAPIWESSEMKSIWMYRLDVL